MLYAIICEELPGALERRLSNRPAHLERLAVLQAEGRLILAGPHPLIDSEDAGPAGFSGSLTAGICDTGNIK
ncbi:MAG: YciI family protein, partial [Pseudomonadota bacterium]